MNQTEENDETIYCQNMRSTNEPPTHMGLITAKWQKKLFFPVYLITDKWKKFVWFKNRS